MTRWLCLMDSDEYFQPRALPALEAASGAADNESAGGGGNGKGKGTALRKGPTLRKWLEVYTQQAPPGSMQDLCALQFLTQVRVYAKVVGLNIYSR
jgi:hypothetical protein